MKLWEFLLSQKCIYYARASETIVKDKEFNQNMGRIYMCDTIYELLSDETLQLDVKTRSEVIKNKEEKDDTTT